MLKNRLILMVLSLFLVSVWGVLVVSADTVCIPTGTIAVTIPDSIEPKRSQVEFPHGSHFVFNCMECHHQWDGVAEVLSCSTSGCHDLDKAPERPIKHLEYTDESIRYFKYAFHKKCIGCHREMKIENKQATQIELSLDDPPELRKTGPTGCVVCHPRQ